MYWWNSWVENKNYVNCENVSSNKEMKTEQNTYVDEYKLKDWVKENKT